MKNTDMEYFSEMVSIIPPICAAIIFEIADAKNHNPKINPTNRFGESLLT